MTFNHAAARTWLEGPNPEAQEYTVAETLDIEEDFNSKATDGWVFTIERLVAMALDATQPRLLPEGTLVWLTCDTDGELDGVLVTRNYDDAKVRLCSAYLDLNDIVVDETMTGIENAVSVLEAIHQISSELTLPAPVVPDDEKADDEVVCCTECGQTLPASSERCEFSEDGEHVPDMVTHEPPADNPTRNIRLDLVVTVPNDGYDYSGDVGGRIERLMGHLLRDRLVTRVESGGPSGSGYAGDVTKEPAS